TTVGDRLGVGQLRLGQVHERTGEELGGTGLDDGTATQHLTDDDLDVLVVDGHTLCTVDSLHLIDEVLLHTTTTQNLQDVMRSGGTAQQTGTGGDVVTLGQGALDERSRVVFHRNTDGGQALTLRQLVVDDIVG